MIRQLLFFAFEQQSHCNQKISRKTISQMICYVT